MKTEDIFYCPHFQDLPQQNAGISQDVHDAIRSLMWHWHKHQKIGCAIVLAILKEAQTS